MKFIKKLSYRFGNNRYTKLDYFIDKQIKPFLSYSSAFLIALLLILVLVGVIVK